MSRPWLDPAPAEVPAALAAAVGGHPLVAATLVRRGITTPTGARTFLDPEHYTPQAPSGLPDLPAAADRLDHALRHRERILVWGDFDVDGQTSTTLLVQSLRNLGGQVAYHIPVRARESHGINLPVLERLLQDGFDLLLTCDTGVAAHEAVGFAHERGLAVIITDHHELPRDPDGAPDLPPALAVINPRRLSPDHPLVDLPGAGVAYKLVEELYRRRSLSAEFSLDLVALGIVADLAVLRNDTRYLAQRGLQVLRRTERTGLRLLAQGAEIDLSGVTEEHIAFGLAPRLNALGRLDDANPIVEFLTTTDRSQARVLALELEGLNAHRRLLTSQILQGALAQIEAEPAYERSPALVLAHPAWPAGVIGIVASQLVERFHKPTILISAPPGEPARGSARSIPGLNISRAIATQAALLDGFGGHPMAAGLALDPEASPAFRQAFNRTVAEMQSGRPAAPPLEPDAFLALEDLSLDLAADLERLAPFGPGNPPIILASKDLHLLSDRPLGRSGEHRRLQVADASGAAQTVIWWNSREQEPPTGSFDLAYTLRANDFGGQTALQLQWLEARPHRTQTLELIAAAPLKVEDYRHLTDPSPLLARLGKKGSVLVWSEANRPGIPAGVPRHELTPTHQLVVATSPPGQAELALALETAQPEIVYLLAFDPGMDNRQAFLTRLAGLVKYTLNRRQGHTSLTALAAATAQRLMTVQIGLDWLAAQGHLVFEQLDPDQLVFRPGLHSNPALLPGIETRLDALLAESRAFRRYYRQSPPAALISI